MDSRITKLNSKEVINVRTGERYGYVGDLEIDMENGRVTALVVPGRLRFLGLFGRERERIFSWNCIRRVGEDIILVDTPAEEWAEK